MYNKKSGFTLIELLVVIAIIGILSSVVIVSLNSSRGKARNAKREVDMEAIQKALALYYDSNNSYPDAIGSLVTAGLLSTTPVAPNIGESYHYVRSNDALSYHLGTDLEGIVSGGVLANDRDCNSNDTPPTNCPGFVDRPNYPGAVPFNGVDPMLDVTP
ncbi:MAG: type II secretion system protein [bacterium]|nr:type II secretion system protein [bacterium]